MIWTCRHAPGTAPALTVCSNAAAVQRPSNLQKALRVLAHARHGGQQNPLQAQARSCRAGSPSAVMQGQGGGGEVQLPSGRRIWLRSEAKLVRKPSPGTTLYILQPARNHPNSARHPCDGSCCRLRRSWAGALQGTTAASSKQRYGVPDAPAGRGRARCFTSQRLALNSSAKRAHCMQMNEIHM